MGIICKHCGFENDIWKEFCDKCGFPLSCDVFISYSRKDYVDENGNPLEESFLATIKEALNSEGISYWFDEEGILSGDEFASIITQGIRESAVFLFVSSKNSNQSHWTSNEISIAKKKKKPIIPVKLDDTPYNDSVMMKIISLDYVDCTVNKEKAIAKIIRAVKRRLHKHVKSFELSSIEDESNQLETISSVDSSEIISPVIEKDAPILVPLNDIDLGPQTVSQIRVNISDRLVPIVMFVGPAAVGKTMTLVRLVRYLSEHGYVTEPDRAFRDSKDKVYDRLCKSFQILVNSGYAASGTSFLDCILVKTFKNGRKVIQMVDMAGELFFNQYMSSSTIKMPPFFHTIVNSGNPIVWVIMMEPHWSDTKTRMKYSALISQFKRHFMSPKDRVIILYNKIDTTELLEGRTTVHKQRLLSQIDEEYPGALLPFININPITKSVRKYNCQILPFMTGHYSLNDRMLVFSPSDSAFPEQLWKAISKAIR